MNNIVEKCAAVLMVGVLALAIILCFKEQRRLNSSPRTTFQEIVFQTEVNTNLIGATIGEGLLLQTNILSATPILENLPSLVNQVINQNSNIVRSTSTNVWIEKTGNTFTIVEIIDDGQP